MPVTKEQMIEHHIIKRGIKDNAVIKAIREVDRKDFLSESLAKYAYEDGPLPIGKGQTISQPYIVAFMAEALSLNKNSRVLEVGTGCGYNAAVLSKLANHVYTVEIIDWLAERAQKTLDALNYENIFIKYGDGYKGWPDKGPFDAIIITAAPPAIPEPLKEQLKVGGKLLAPVGTIRQELIMLEKIEERKYRQRNLMPVRFVPMTGQAQKTDFDIPKDANDAADTY
ncbi:MAG: protein-L-isoaspartate O-methyltransferase [Halobacteriovoraceae bacterium]|nr:protein-L-isoaspartate O-methyltransferase [Halobacteriovoraceae bacterium]|tara:strand:+ start:54817 stop:55494 length:678 start_codon:yes stop_codon:yes gene_type:complete